MNVHIFNNEQQVYDACAILVATQLIENSESVLGLATGSTPVGMYTELARLNQDGVISFAEATTFNLDEYVGLDHDHEQSYYHFMMENLFDAVDIDEENIHVPYGATDNLNAECEAYEEMIADMGGIDLQLLGIGVNGHIGFNEPSDVFSSGTHVVELTESTIQANSRFFDHVNEVPRQGLTMGIGTIMSAMKIVLIATGKNKAKAIKAMIEGQVDPMLPASVLQLHSDTVVLLDRDAASLLLDESTP